MRFAGYPLVIAVLSALPLAAMADDYCEVIVFGGGAPWRFTLEDSKSPSCAKLLHEEGASERACLQETTAEVIDTHRYQHEDSKSFWDLRTDGLMTGYVEIPTTETPGIDMVPFGGTCQEVV